MLGFTIPDELLGSVAGILVLATIYTLLLVFKLRERIAVLEEWVRQYERKNGGRV